MKLLMVLPNFTILVDAGNLDEYFKLAGQLRCFCVKENNSEHVVSYKITPKSFWYGLNSTNDDFIKLLNDNSKTKVDSTLIKELEKFKEKFGKITLSNNSLIVNDSEILEQIKCNTSLKEYIKNIEGKVVQLDEVNLGDLQDTLIEEIGYPFKVDRDKDFIKTVWKLKSNND